MKQLFFGAALAFLSGGFLHVQAQATAPGVLRSGLYGGTGDDHPRCIVQDRDSGYVIGGWTFSFDEQAASTFKSGVNALVIRTDAKGNFKWSRVLAGSGYEIANTVATYGKTVIVGGEGLSTDGDFTGMPSKKGFIAWLDSADGHLLRIRAYSGDLFGSVSKINVLSGGKLLVCGTKQHTAGGKAPEGAAAWVALLDDTGSVIWERYLGGTAMMASGTGVSAVQKADGGYMMLAQISPVSGATIPGAKGSQDFALVNMDPKANILWVKYYGGTANDMPLDLVHTQDGGFIAGGSTVSTDGDVSKALGKTDYWVFKTDKDGKLLWQKSFGGSENDQFCSLSGTCDNGVVVYGHTFSKNGDATDNKGVADMLIFRLDDKGDALWHRCYGGSQGDWEGAVTTTREGNYAFAGVTGHADGDITGTIRGSGDYWLAILGSDGLHNYCPIVTPPPLSLEPVLISSNTLKIYPNPVQGQLTIESKEPVQAVLSDIQGRVLLQSAAGSLDMSQLAPGMYLLTCSDQEGHYLASYKIYRQGK